MRVSGTTIDALLEAITFSCSFSSFSPSYLIHYVTLASILHEPARDIDAN